MQFQPWRHKPITKFMNCEKAPPPGLSHAIAICALRFGLQAFKLQAFELFAFGTVGLRRVAIRLRGGRTQPARNRRCTSGRTRAVDAAG